MGKRNKSEAQVICQGWQQAKNEAANGELTKDRVSEIFNETLKRIGGAPPGANQYQELDRRLVKDETGKKRGYEKGLRSGSTRLPGVPRSAGLPSAT